MAAPHDLVGSNTKISKSGNSTKVPSKALGEHPPVGDAGIMRFVSFARGRIWLACAFLALAAPLCAQTAQSAQSAAATPAVSSAYYIVHAGDVLVINFRYTPEFNDEVTVGPDGRAALKATGDITLAGLTLPEIQQAIISGSTDKLVNPEVAVLLKDFERPNFVVAGEVQKPGPFDLRKPTTVLQAILMAGGPKDDSAMNHVYLFRRINSDTAEVHQLRLSHYDANSRAKNDLLLQPGDMILVNRDALDKIGRFIKTFNLGVYLNPTTSGLF